jgi:hypothetical protein
VGYGWLDNVNSHASQYWEALMDYENSEAIFVRGLHNYLLNIGHVYGLAGLLAVFYMFYKKFKYYGIVVVFAFSPYYINAIFHNGGTFYGGNYIWVFLGVLKYYFDFVIDYYRFESPLIRKSEPSDDNVLVNN